MYSSFKSSNSFPKGVSPIRHAKSMQSLHVPNMEELSTALEKFHYNSTFDRRLSDSSIEITVINDSGSDVEVSIDRDDQVITEDSGVSGSYVLGADVLELLEQKIDTLKYVFEEQSKLLSCLKAEVRHTTEMVERVAREHNQITLEVIRFALSQKLDVDTKTQAAASLAGEEASSEVNSRAKALLDALVTKQKSQSSTIDGLIKTALSEFLHSDALKDRMLSATTESVQQVIKGSFTEDVTSCYLPLLMRSNEQLQAKIIKTLHDMFKEVETNTLSVTRSPFKTSRLVRSALMRHQRLVESCTQTHAHFMDSLRNTLHQVLKSELMEFRGKIKSILVDSAAEESQNPVEQTFVPSSPPQPVDPGRSIEQLMTAAEINMLLKSDVNASFSRALSANDLVLVMAACRAADPAVIFSPCQLQQPVLLSLTQQLATDLVHDTQLKCKYLENAIMNLDSHDAVTRTHLPKVIGEVSRNLKIFLNKFPRHLSSRRIKMLIMAANSLLKDNAQMPMVVTYKT